MDQRPLFYQTAQIILESSLEAQTQDQMSCELGLSIQQMVLGCFDVKRAGNLPNLDLD